MEIISKDILHHRLQEGDEAYNYNAFEEMSESEKTAYVEKLDLYEKNNPYSKLMKSVPHLKLDVPPFDAKRSHEEIVKHIGDDFVPINMRNVLETEEHGPINHQHWSARAIINYTPHSDKWLQKQSKESATWKYPELQPRANKLINKVPRLELDDMEYYKTDLYDKLSYTSNYIFENIADNTYKVFIWRIGKEGYLNWHNHAKLPWHKDLVVNDKAIVHLPVITHPDIRMIVDINDTLYSEYYEPGSAYVFNGIQDHAVENKTDVNRLHVVAFIPWNDPKFEKVLERSLNA